MGNTIHKQANDRVTGTPLNRGVNACGPKGSGNRHVSYKPGE